MHLVDKIRCSDVRFLHVIFCARVFAARAWIVLRASAAAAAAASCEAKQAQKVLIDGLLDTVARLMFTQN